VARNDYEFTKWGETELSSLSDSPTCIPRVASVLAPEPFWWIFNGKPLRGAQRETSSAMVLKANAVWYLVQIPWVQEIARSTADLWHRIGNGNYIALHPALLMLIMHPSNDGCFWRCILPLCCRFSTMFLCKQLNVHVIRSSDEFDIRRSTRVQYQIDKLLYVANMHLLFYILIFILFYSCFQMFHNCIIYFQTDPRGTSRTDSLRWRVVGYPCRHQTWHQTEGVVRRQIAPFVFRNNIVSMMHIFVSITMHAASSVFSFLNVKFNQCQVMPLMRGEYSRKRII